MKNLFNNLAHRSFSLALDPPKKQDPEDIRRTVRKFADNTGQDIVFLDSDAPVAFYLDEVLFSAAVCDRRGGAYILCTEQIPEVAR